MALTKAGVVQTIAPQTGLTKNQSCHAFEKLMKLMKNTPASGEDVIWEVTLLTVFP